MDIQPLPLPGVYEITLEPKRDHRGFFMRTYDETLFRNHGIARKWLQENHSYSEKKGTVRGLHFQLPPFSETKLIRVIKGAVWDVFVDVRPDSPTFGKWGAVELTEANFKMVLIPRGFAHGFCTLMDHTEVLYKVDNVYSPSHEAGIRWNDPALHIPWPAESPILSEKDKRLPMFNEILELLKGKTFAQGGDEHEHPPI